VTERREKHQDPSHGRPVPGRLGFKQRCGDVPAVDVEPGEAGEEGHDERKSARGNAAGGGDG
jgi:hypothetical protein